jgi:ABC-type ATPase involved in cell division
MIKLENVTKAYRATSRPPERQRFDIAKGEFVFLVGRRARARAP